ncbi:cysteinyl-tRNA synthetase [Leptospira ryugenii]|uniref:Cysteine--tRNA ligase n=1 Tax=Leptospira ryugenii TaxID=1917863 RepID=A0A2P2DWV4_9LEPT|nr:cysteine--tRNA ligase [Leptospira ryugenii]GBF49113.1 cysteinyl-tRNA synthetase [Leptospira ryugenii]
MDFLFYNTKTGKKEVFKPKDPSEVKIYSCGPTVYNFAHIGNLRSFLFVDILRRSLKLAGFQLNQTMNITDIDDKIIREAIANHMSVEEFTKPWTERFFEDLKSLHVDLVENYPRATESIHDMISIVHKLIENGFAYEKDGSIYYSIQKFENYGKLSHIDVSGMKSGARYDADEYEKEDVRDFVLWKNRKTEDEKAWETDLGIGRPGWHLECSAMIRKVYDSGIDIHTGGIDLLFPHHENEVALSEGAFPEEQFVGTWLHCEHLLVDSEKMSKSKGNFYTLRDLLDLGHSLDAIRFHLISVHYRSKLNFSLKHLPESKQAIERIQTALTRLLKDSGYLTDSEVKRAILEIKKEVTYQSFSKVIVEFEEALKDDLNLPKALASVFDFVRETNSALDQETWSIDLKKEAVRVFQIFDSVLAVLRFTEPDVGLPTDLVQEIEMLIAKRAEAKKNKQYDIADKIRKELLEKGITLLDTKDGTTSWKKSP